MQFLCVLWTCSQIVCCVEAMVLVSFLRSADAVGKYTCLSWCATCDLPCGSVYCVFILLYLLSCGHHGSTGPDGHAGNCSVLTTCLHAAGVRQRLLDSESGSGAMESMDRDLSYLSIGKTDET